MHVHKKTPLLFIRQLPDRRFCSDKGFFHTLRTRRKKIQEKEKKEEKEYDAWFRAQVQEGLDDMEAGRYISHEEMMRLINEQNARLDQINGCSRSAA